MEGCSSWGGGGGGDPVWAARLHRPRRRFWGRRDFLRTYRGGAAPACPLSPTAAQIPRGCHQTRQPAFNRQEVTELLPRGGDGGTGGVLLFLFFFRSALAPFPCLARLALESLLCRVCLPHTRSDSPEVPLKRSRGRENPGLQPAHPHGRAAEGALRAKSNMSGHPIYYPWQGRAPQPPSLPTHSFNPWQARSPQAAAAHPAPPRGRGGTTQRG